MDSANFFRYHQRLKFLVVSESLDLTSGLKMNKQFSVEFYKNRWSFLFILKKGLNVIKFSFEKLDSLVT